MRMDSEVGENEKLYYIYKVFPNDILFTANYSVVDPRPGGTEDSRLWSSLQWFFLHSDKNVLFHWLKY